MNILYNNKKYDNGKSYYKNELMINICYKKLK